MASPVDFDARLVRIEGFKLLLQHFERVSDDKKASLKVGVALVDWLLRLMLRAS
jgi:hypothetical protein